MIRYLKSKAEVDYSNGMKTRHCGICVHFKPPHRCEKVAGVIEPSKWCKLFRKKPAPPK